MEEKKTKKSLTAAQGFALALGLLVHGSIAIFNIFWALATVVVGAAFIIHSC